MYMYICACTHIYMFNIIFFPPRWISIANHCQCYFFYLSYGVEKMYLCPWSLPVDWDCFCDLWTLFGRLEPCKPLRWKWIQSIMLKQILLLGVPVILMWLKRFVVFKVCGDLVNDGLAGLKVYNVQCFKVDLKSHNTFGSSRMISTTIVFFFP